LAHAFYKDKLLQAAEEDVVWERDSTLHSYSVIERFFTQEDTTNVAKAGKFKLIDSDKSIISLTPAHNLSISFCL